MDSLIRVEQLIGKEKADKLKNTCVAVFGVGGVGGFCVEALARSGVGKFLLIDSDVVEESNINRQIIATVNTVGRAKTEVVKERILAINPSAEVIEKRLFYLPETANEINLQGVDYIVDAVDTVTAKIHIIKSATELNIPVISCMGTAGKLDVSKLKVDFIEKTTVCPLAKVVRNKLKQMGIKKVKVVYSTEDVKGKAIDGENGKHTPPSMIFVPATAGLMMASEVIKELTQEI
ncbi:MAG: tRNA threonylcarbamoyladenosine dehydratase [Clostridiales bacterium]|nr:tRNA threonylcarbamoyladenosine dehydratase [Clostridiales bacterium]